MLLKLRGVVEKVKGIRVAVDVDYDLYGKLQYICGQNNWHIEDSEFSDRVKIYILAQEDTVEQIEKELYRSNKWESYNN